MAEQERKKQFETSSGIPIDAVVGPDPSFDADVRLGLPGHFPFTRGVHPTMYRGRLWTMRQYAGFADAAETNRRYHYLLSQGQTGLSVAFDLPTQMGYDSDHAMAGGEVGKVGVAISSLEDMRTLLDGIPLEKVSISMTINATAPILLAFVAAIAKERGTPLGSLSGTVQNDILKEYIARGTYIYPPAPSLRLAIDLFEYCLQHVPKWNFISISGYHIREAGSTAAQELGFTLADGIAYMEEAVRRGLDVNAVGTRVSFFFNAHNQVLEEVAKFRAARRMWARIMRDRFKATDPRAQMLRFHTQTAGSTLTAQQTDNNVVRVALQALSAVLGGTQSLHTNSRDEALGLPTQVSSKLALRTQQIIAYESGTADVVDPFGGSYVVERLTDELEARAQAYIEKVDALGGAAKAVEARYFQGEIERSAYEAQQRLDEGRDVVVGMNRFTEEEAGGAEVTRVDASLGERRAAGLAAWRKARDAGRCQAALARLGEAARGTTNLLPPIVEAIEANATLGEISDALREVFGEHRRNLGRT